METVTEVSLKIPGMWIVEGLMSPVMKAALTYHVFQLTSIVAQPKDSCEKESESQLCRG